MKKPIHQRRILTVTVMRIVMTVMMFMTVMSGIPALAAEAEAGTSAAGSTAAASEQPKISELEQAKKQKKTGMIKSGSSYYYLKKGVVQKKLLIKVKGKKRYFKGNGKAAANEVVKIGKKYYYFKADTTLGTAKKARTLKTKAGWYFVYRNGTVAKNGWQRIGKTKYYSGKNGKLCTGVSKAGSDYYWFTSTGELKKPGKDKIVRIGKTDYLVRKDGKMGSDWCAIGKKYYYCKANGKILKNTTKDGTKLNADGTAKTVPVAAKLAVKAANVVASITRPGMSQGAKIRACWNYITSHSNFYYSTAIYPSSYSTAEFRRIALLMLNGRAGNCYCFASAFAALTKAAGCTSYVVYGLCPGTRDGRADGMTRHCWVYISGHGYFDPEACYAGFASIYGGGHPWSMHGRAAI